MRVCLWLQLPVMLRGDEMSDRDRKSCTSTVNNTMYTVYSHLQIHYSLPLYVGLTWGKV